MTEEQTVQPQPEEEVTVLEPVEEETTVKTAEIEELKQRLEKLEREIRYLRGHCVLSDVATMRL